MATIRLVPSNYDRSSTNSVTVTNPSNMYNNTDHTSNYATLRGRAGSSWSSSTYYAFINGFNFDDVPANAIVTDFKVKIKAYRGKYQATGSTNYRICLASQASNNSKIGNTTLSSDITTTSGGAVYEIPTGSLTWDQLVDYGSSFSIDIPLRNSSTSSSNYPYVYVYGAEIEVDYTMPVYHNITITGTNVTPTGTQSILEGSSLSIRSSDSVKPIVLDNNIDVTSQVIQQTESESYSVENITTTYGFALNNNQYYESNNEGHSSSAAVAKIDFHLPVSANIVFSVINYAESTYDYGLLSNIDTTLNTNASADSSNVYWSGKNNNSSSVQTVTYSNVPAGDHYIYAKYFKDNYTDSYNDSFQFKVTINLNESFTPGTYWVYTLNNITADHNIVFSSESLKKVYLKINGTWTQYSKIYKKVNGSWVEQDDWSSIFNTSANYVKG